MRYKKAKKKVQESFKKDGMEVIFGWKFRFFPSQRRQMKQWANELNSEKSG